MHFYDLLVENIKENFAEIHLPNWLSYLPQAIGQWDMSSPAYNTP